VTNRLDDPYAVRVLEPARSGSRPIARMRNRRRSLAAKNVSPGFHVSGGSAELKNTGSAGWPSASSSTYE
jgi:hypothetical protein